MHQTRLKSSSSFNTPPPFESFDGMHDSDSNKLFSPNEGESSLLLDNQANSKKSKAKTQKQSVSEWLQDTLFDLFLSSGLNAMLKHLNVRKYRDAKLFKGKLGYCGIAFNVLMLAFFATLFAINYDNLHHKQKFVAVDQSSGDCNPVARPYSFPLISADYDGNWLGQYDFNANKNYYMFNLYALSLTQSSYEAFMTRMGNAVRQVGEISKYHELSTNLLTWHAWFHDEQMESPDLVCLYYRYSNWLKSNVAIASPPLLGCGVCRYTYSPSFIT